MTTSGIRPASKSGSPGIIGGTVMIPVRAVVGWKSLSMNSSFPTSASVSCEKAGSMTSKIYDSASSTTKLKSPSPDVVVVSSVDVPLPSRRFTVTPLRPDSPVSKPSKFVSSNTRPPSGTSLSAMSMSSVKYVPNTIPGDGLEIDSVAVSGPSTKLSSATVIVISPTA